MPLTGARAGRLVLIGNIPVDLTMRVDVLPIAGEDVLAEAALVAPGGGFHVLCAAQRYGLPVAYAGTHGSGPLGEMVRRGLAEIDCALLSPPLPDCDSGWVVALADANGERTFVSSPEVFTPYSTEMLGALPLQDSDLLCVSGYSLGLGEASSALATWVSDLSLDRVVMCDLGPYGANAAPPILERVLGRIDWLACNEVEAGRLTGSADPAEAARRLNRRTTRAGVLVRVGPRGCWLALAGTEPVVVPAPPVARVVDTNGAGDTHTGVFLAALARGSSPYDAVVSANDAAADLVSGYRRTHGPGL